MRVRAREETAYSGGGFWSPNEGPHEVFSSMKCSDQIECVA